MFDSMRRLHPRGPLSRGVSVDADGAMLGPDCALVRRTVQGYRPISRNEASVLQAFVCRGPQDSDRLYRTCGRIAEALENDQLALAQIYGLHLPIDELGPGQLRGLSKFARVSKVGYNPDEPRVPAGNPHGGEWTTGGGEDAGGASEASEPPGGGDGGDSGDGGEGDGSDAPATADPGYGGSDAPPDGGSGAGGDASNDSAISYQIAPAATVAAVEAAAAESLLGQLTGEAVLSLAELAAGMVGPTFFLGTLFFPAGGSPIIDGRIENSPDLAYRYDRDTGFLQIWQADASGDHALLYNSQIGPDDFLHDTSGRAIRHLLQSWAVIVYPAMLQGSQARNMLAVRPAAQTGAQARERQRTQALPGSKRRPARRATKQPLPTIR